MDNMFFTKRDEYIFIDYVNVIKNPDIFILKMIKSKLGDAYKDFIDVDRVKNMTELDMEIFLLTMRGINILDELKIKHFNTTKAYDDIYYKYDDMFVKSKLLRIGNTIKFLATNKFTKKIYLYTDKYDARVDIDINIEFNGIDNIEYVHGEFSEVLSNIYPPTSYILNNQYNILTVDYHKKIEYTDILLARYSSNLCIRDNEVMPTLLIENLLKNNVFKFALFQPIDLDEKHQNLLKNYI